MTGTVSGVDRAGDGTPLARGPEAALQTLLAWSEGFLVDGPKGEVGVVDELVFGDGGRVAGLRVSSGSLARVWCVIPIEEIVEIRPRARTIVVARHPDDVHGY